jgi:hypothetical protein
MLIYLGGVIWLSVKYEIWHNWMLWDAIFWFFGTALVMFFSINKATAQGHFFRRAAIGTLTLATLLEFIVDLYPFALSIELIIVPVAIVLGALQAVAGTQKQFASVKIVINWLIGLMGLAFLLHASNMILIHPTEFFNLKNFLQFLEVPLLTISFLPFIYLLALYSAYETAFIRVDLWIGKRNQKLGQAVKWLIMRRGNLRLNRVRDFSRDVSMRLMNVKSIQEAYATLDKTSEEH